ncbi:dynein axonemal assembly factor 19-like [Antedon mediterranea]|uniref:dynein axonemal assembly factor 19-like n=1 Tax=Antedon mediterranea TaxID=105859 RepID=UPI003AF94A90
MADPNEDTIDFQKLEKELSLAVDAHNKYWRENDAKFRAVEQRVETYEQFRDIVAASHLKPLEKGDKEGLGRPRQQPWNPYVNKNDKDVQNLESKTDQPLQIPGHLPKDGHEFMQQWKRLADNQQEKYNYILQFDADQLFSTIKHEISFGLLGEILKLFNMHFKEENCTDIFLILKQLSNTKRFSLSIDFLSKKEAQHRDELMAKLQTVLKCSDFDLKSLTKIYGKKSVE